MAALAAAAPGCYRKVVNARGIGADSVELRDSREFDLQKPLRPLTTTNERQKKPASGVW
jgi:hypothetical protein